MAWNLQHRAGPCWSLQPTTVRESVWRTDRQNLRDAETDRQTDTDIRTGLWYPSLLLQSLLWHSAVLYSRSTPQPSRCKTQRLNLTTSQRHISLPFIQFTLAWIAITTASSRDDEKEVRFTQLCVNANCHFYWAVMFKCPIRVCGNLV